MSSRLQAKAFGAARSSRRCPRRESGSRTSILRAPGCRASGFRRLQRISSATGRARSFRPRHGYCLLPARRSDRRSAVEDRGALPPVARGRPRRHRTFLRRRPGAPRSAAARKESCSSYPNSDTACALRKSMSPRPKLRSSTFRRDAERQRNAAPASCDSPR